MRHAQFPTLTIEAMGEDSSEHGTRKNAPAGAISSLPSNATPPAHRPATRGLCRRDAEMCTCSLGSSPSSGHRRPAWEGGAPQPYDATPSRAKNAINLESIRSTAPARSSSRALTKRSSELRSKYSQPPRLVQCGRKLRRADGWPRATKWPSVENNKRRKRNAH